MTSPTPVQSGTSSGASRPGNRRLAAATAALLAAVGLYAALHRPAPVTVRLCTIGDTAHPQVVANIVGTDTLITLDSVFLAHLDSASTGPLYLVPPCENLDRDTSAAHRAQLAAHDSAMRADSLKWIAGDTASLSSDRDYWRALLGAPGKSPAQAPP